MAWVSAKKTFGQKILQDIDDCKKERLMAVEKVGEKYKCNVCGNEVTVTKAGGGELVCCGQPMEKVEG